MTALRRALGPSLRPRRLAAGALAGLAGGLLFGAMMASAGMMAMVAMLAGGGGDAVGWPLHLALSAAFGAAFAAGVRPAAGPSLGLALGVAWGVGLWLVAAMLVMRTALGMPVQFDPMALRSLAGHVAFGAVLGTAYAALPLERLLARGAAGPA